VLLVVSIGLSKSRLAPLSTLHWILLSVGLSQLPMLAVGAVMAWILLLAYRERNPELTSGWFNLRQVTLVGATVVALTILGAGVYSGLLGSPEMQIRGNGSTSLMLRWFEDRTGAEMPRAWVLSVPMFIYRGAMLAWSLWMAFALVSWLKWGWQAFSNGGLWRTPPPRPPLEKKV
jgi:hypothetical protein